MPFGCSRSGWVWLDVAQDLGSLAPRLAPWGLVSEANVRMRGLVTQPDSRVDRSLARARLMRRLATSSQWPDWREAQSRHTCYTSGQLLAAGTKALHIRSLACHDYESCVPVKALRITDR